MPIDKETIKLENTLTILMAILYDHKIETLKLDLLGLILKKYENVEGLKDILGDISLSFEIYLPKIIQYGYLKPIDEKNYQITMDDHAAQLTRKAAQKSDPQKYQIVENLTNVYRQIEKALQKNQKEEEKLPEVEQPVIENKSAIVHQEPKEKTQSKGKSITTIPEFFLAFFSILNQSNIYILDENIFLAHFGFSFYDSNRLSAFLKEVFEREFKAQDIIKLFYKFLETPAISGGKLYPSILQRREIDSLSFFMNGGTKGREILRNLTNEDYNKLLDIEQIYLNEPSLIQKNY